LPKNIFVKEVDYQEYGSTAFLMTGSITIKLTKLINKEKLP
jgi:hypothetical protein